MPHSVNTELEGSKFDSFHCTFCVYFKNLWITTYRKVKLLLRRYLVHLAQNADAKFRSDALCRWRSRARGDTFRLDRICSRQLKLLFSLSLSLCVCVCVCAYVCLAVDLSGALQHAALVETFDVISRDQVFIADSINNDGVILHDPSHVSILTDQKNIMLRYVKICTITGQCQLSLPSLQGR